MTDSFFSTRLLTKLWVCLIALIPHYLDCTAQSPTVSFTLPAFYKSKSNTSDMYTECVDKSENVFWYFNKPLTYFEDSCMLCRDMSKGKVMVEYMRIESRKWLMVSKSKKGTITEIGVLSSNGELKRNIDGFMFEGVGGVLTSASISTYGLNRTGVWLFYDKKGIATLKQY